MLAPHFASLIASAFPIPLDPPVIWNRTKISYKKFVVISGPERDSSRQPRLYMQEKGFAITSYQKTYHNVSPIYFSFLLREKVVRKNAKKASKQGNNYQAQHTRVDYRNDMTYLPQDWEEPLTKSFCQVRLLTNITKNFTLQICISKNLC